MVAIPVAIASAVLAVEIAAGGTLPEKVIQFVKPGLCPSEFPNGYLFVKREHLVFFQLKLQEYLPSGIYQHRVFTLVAAIRCMVRILDA